VGGASFPEEFWVYYYMEQALPLLDPTSKDEWIGVLDRFTEICNR
jgi:hypothetical protein